MKQATERPVRTLESGPAAGAIASAAFGLQVGHADVISFDMGGTTAKAAVATGGVAGLTTYFELERVENRRGSGLPVDIPAIDLVEVGTGGGRSRRSATVASVSGLAAPARNPAPPATGAAAPSRRSPTRICFSATTTRTSLPAGFASTGKRRPTRSARSRRRSGSA